jgi:hypothetical protein
VGVGEIGFFYKEHSVEIEQVVLEQRPEVRE